MFLETRLTAERIRLHTDAGHWTNQVLRDFVEKHARERPDHVAIAESYRHPAVTYRDLLDLSDRVALGLLEQGIRAGDVVSVQLPNWHEYVILLLAIERIGAVINPLTTILRERELTQMLEIGGSKMLVVPDTFRGVDFEAQAGRLRDAVRCVETVVVVSAFGDSAEPPPQPSCRGRGSLSWRDLLGKGTVDDRDRAWLDRLRLDANAVTELAFTSGTTGVPKGVLHTHNTAVATVGSTMRRQGIDHSKVVHVVTPVGHNAGYFYGVRISLQSGAMIVFQDVWDPREALRLIQEHRVTFSYGASTFLIDLLACPEFDDHDLSSFEIYMCGGASIPPALAEECMRRLPGRLCPIFGMTEHGHSTGTDPGTSFEKVCSTDGSPQPEMELKVVDDDGNRLPPRTEGRLMLRGPFNFIGYIQGREFSEQFFDNEDFFDTGDLAYLDEDGYLRITGRAKDLIIRGGENVPVKEVEDILAKHPDVLEVAIVGAPDPRLGERGVAFLRMLPDRSMDLDRMRDFLREQQVTQQFWPEAVEVVDEFPRTASGKIQKFKLRETVSDLFQ